ncbi:Uu.00g013700.m01.CDS01 [Anthostomella pinea]|uniref:Uu.00g013700.m01.CDS01 n=1 Tax=Anthostomella pinea TaxID=933095 RepID=A0AAI8YQD4_9PEZI|nr:Uu.00g013700.m01.CDS01 [Anthostomella pinea]
MPPVTISGQELIDLAWQQQPIAASDFAAGVTTATIVVLVLSALAVGLRVWVRTSFFLDRQIWGWDDTLAVLSLVTFIPSCVFIILAAHYGLGRRDADITPLLRARAALYLGYWQMFYATSTNLVKAGIAMTLLRLTAQRRYRYPILGIMISPALFTVGVVIVLVTTCYPLGAQWDLALARCAAHDVMAQLSYLFTVFTVLLDWACAVIPYLLLRDLEMRKAVKITLLAVLMFGGLAGVCAIIRLPYLKYYLIEKDQLYYFANIVLWSTVENAIGIIAASLPMIRKLFGIYATSSREESQPVERAGAVETIGGTPLTKHHTSIQLKSMSSSRLKSSTLRSGEHGRWNRLDGANSSQEEMVRSNTGGRY